MVHKCNEQRADSNPQKHGRIGDMVVTAENCLGHESAGEVIAVGEGVTRFHLGKWPYSTMEKLSVPSTDDATSQEIALPSNAASHA